MNLSFFAHPLSRALPSTFASHLFVLCLEDNPAHTRLLQLRLNAIKAHSESLELLVLKICHATLRI